MLGMQCRRQGHQAGRSSGGCEVVVGRELVVVFAVVGRELVFVFAVVFDGWCV
jgi:hypothetical protein